MAAGGEKHKWAIPQMNLIINRPLNLEHVTIRHDGRDTSGYTRTIRSQLGTDTHTWFSGDLLSLLFIFRQGWVVLKLVKGHVTVFVTNGAYRLCLRW